MSKYLKLREKLSVFSYFALFVSVAILMFGFFYLYISRPMSMMKERMNNSEVSWEEIKTNIVKVNFGDSPSRVIDVLGEPDAKYPTVTKTVYSYQKYGLYTPKFYYEIEFRKDTLYEVLAHE